MRRGGETAARDTAQAGSGETMAQIFGILSVILGLLASVLGGPAMGAFGTTAVPTAGMALGPVPPPAFAPGFTQPAPAALGQPITAGFQPPAPTVSPTGGQVVGPVNLGPVATGPEGSGAPLTVKSGANISSLRPEIRGILPLVVQVWQRHSAPTPVITSGNDSTHRSGSLHYSDLAVDLRGNNIDPSTAQAIRGDLQGALGPAYQVMYETFPDNPSNNHIHVEYDPA